MRVIKFKECSKFHVDLKNTHQNSENFFCFSDKSIWSGSIETSLLRKEYLSWTVNVLTESLETLHVTKSDFFQLNYFHSDLWICKDTGVEIESVFRRVYHAACGEVISNALFEHVSRGPYFSELISYESNLFLKMFKICFRFEKSTQKLRKSVLFFR